MRILIVDNNLHVRPYPQGLVVRSHLGRFAPLAYVRKPDELRERDVAVDRVILTGSMAYVRQEESWMATERSFIDRWLGRGARVLGICFGAQLLARHLFGETAVVPMPVPITGSILLRRTRDASGLFAGLPREFGVVTTHYDGCVVPSEYVEARVDEWPCYAFYRPPGAFGIQFHPELMGIAGRAIVRLQRLVYDRHVFQELEVPTRAGHGRRIYRNFLWGPAPRVGRKSPGIHSVASLRTRTRSPTPTRT